jgi:DNA-binding winged helix-turn-helix (wHTH) protein
MDRPPRVLRDGETLRFDASTLAIERGGRNIELNYTCRKILEVLMREYPKVVSRERLERALWGDEPPDSDSLRSHIYALRAAVDRPFDHQMIVTVHRTGYRLTAK